MVSYQAKMVNLGESTGDFTDLTRKKCDFGENHEFRKIHSDIYTKRL